MKVKWFKLMRRALWARMEAESQVKELLGAIEAQDERQRAAGERCGVLFDDHGCDWPDAIAEKMATLKQERDFYKSRMECLARTLRRHWDKNMEESTPSVDKEDGK